jgi:hypothetical protein
MSYLMSGASLFRFDTEEEVVHSDSFAFQIITDAFFTFNFFRRSVKIFVRETW